MEYFQITSPNTCAILINSGGAVVYLDSVAPAKIWPPVGHGAFEQFVTPDEAAARAVEIDPGYDVNNIFGPLALTPVNVSPGGDSAYVGQSVTLNCEYSCEGAEVTYEWLNPGNLVIPGATQSHLTLNNLTERMDGVYTCNVSAQNEKGQTGSATGSFKVTIYPEIVPGASAE